MARNLADEPILPVDNIQGDALVGLLKRVQRLIFFKISNVTRFKRFMSSLRVTRPCGQI
jgi:DyP dimeric alpha+beta barrel domain